MTEEEWLTATDPRKLVGDRYRRDEHERKLQLFGVACCHRHITEITDPRSRQAVTTGELFVDGGATEDELSAASDGAADAWFEENEVEYRYEYQMTLRAAAFNLTQPIAWWYGSVAHEPPYAIILDVCPDRAAEAAVQCALLRDIFGNPFRPVAVDPRWLTSAVVGLAEGIYADRAFDRLPVLADALQDAGCEDDAVLAHCRGDGPHVRGCWVVDLVLGKP